MRFSSGSSASMMSKCLNRPEARNGPFVRARLDDSRSSLDTLPSGRPPPLVNGPPALTGIGGSTP
jgi:hypothetical protein